MFCAEPDAEYPHRESLQKRKRSLSPIFGVGALISDTTTSSQLRKWRNWAKPWRLARVAARPTQGDSSCSSSEQLSHTHIQHLISPMHLLRREQRENPGRLLSH
ncbi:hypothetical protein PoMZ_04814 [Pyricularia oryzae]|uniref:Uncharacterized protein n=1 Tax=Pyricularia oryzae TaxID=318829 RepID=A0A4P7NB79_PYROR|nr:hypothetical protein PoMZ_04814 [Pyricularia oryzae]